MATSIIIRMMVSWFLGALALSLLWGGAGLAAERETASADCKLQAGQESAILAIAAPQTLHLADGRFVQLAEIWMPPQTTSPNAYDASAVTTAFIRDLALGQKAEVRFGGRQRDRYGVYIGHIYITKPNSGGEVKDAQAFETIWLQERLVAAGLALVYPQTDNHACAKALLKVEAEARAAKRGHWARALFQVIPAANTRELMDLAQTYQIVEGSVESATQTSAALILNFGKTPKQDFSVSLTKAIQKQFADKKEASAWQGAKVRVRGWIERRRGPFIAISEGAQIEVLSSAEVPAQQAEQPPKSP